MKKLIALGDIHGQAWKLRDLLNKIYELPIDDDDRLIFLGDYVDRGHDVRLTIDLLMRVKEERPNSIFLRGNHDQTMMDVRDVQDPNRSSRMDLDDVSWWFKYGGHQTMTSYGDGGRRWYNDVPPEHWKFLEDTQLEHREGSYIFVHAGLLPPGRRWFAYSDPRMWVRDEFLDSSYDFGGTVVFGHTAFRDGEPLFCRGRIGIDTGAGYGGLLTAAVLTPFEPQQAKFIQV